MFDLNAYRKRWLTRPSRRGDNNPRPNRCAWVLNASNLEICNRILRPGTTGYCPKHKRMFENPEKYIKREPHIPVCEICFGSGCRTDPIDGTVWPDDPCPACQEKKPEA